MTVNLAVRKFTIVGAALALGFVVVWVDLQIEYYSRYYCEPETMPNDL